MAAQPPKSRRRWLFIGCAVLALTSYFASTGFVHVTETHNGRLFLSRYLFLEESPDHPRLVLLRKRERLDEVVAPGKTQFEKIVLLRRWASRQWASGGPFYYPPWDAVEILDLARKQGNRPFCAQYAIVFLQACRSLGLHARYVNLPGHFVVGVWSDDHNRWVVMDPTFDLHYEKNGVPMKGRDLSRAFWSRDAAGIFKVGSDGKRAAARLDDISEYRGYSILLRANHLSDPAGIEQNGVPRKLGLEAAFAKYPFTGRDRIGFAEPAIGWLPEGGTKVFPAMPYSGDPDDFRGAFNQTIILPAGLDAKNGLAKLRVIAENSPGAEAFLYSVDGSAPRAAGEIIRWGLRPGRNTLSARVRTKEGWLGPPSTISLVYLPGLGIWK